MRNHSRAWIVIASLFASLSLITIGCRQSLISAARTETLTGDDSDSNGVRDDIDSWIAKRFPDSAKVRAALTQLAQDYQRTLSVSENRKDTIEAFNRLIKSNFCLQSVLPDPAPFRYLAYQVARELEAIQMNTYARSKAWIHANVQMKGINDPELMSIPTSDYGKLCKFDPAKLGN